MGTLPTRTAPRRRRRLLLALAALAMAGLAAGQLSLALFTDQETVAATFGTLKGFVRTVQLTLR